MKQGRRLLNYFFFFGFGAHSQTLNLSYFSSHTGCYSSSLTETSAPASAVPKLSLATKPLPIARPK